MVGGRAALASLALTGVAQCTADNPDYNSPNYMMGAPCEGGDRQCVMTTGQRRSYPVVCGMNDSGALALLDERCPSSAGCQAGLCVPPAGAKGCTTQGDCGKTDACVPLVGEARTLQGFCLPAAAAIAAPGQRCDRDEDCQSYLCLPFRSGNHCLKTCATAQDCEIPDDCRSLNITVTGVAGVIQSCLPRS